MDGRSLIGRRIRERRKLAGMSQAELGKELGYSHSAISRIELGTRRLEMGDLERLAAALGEPLEYFIEGVPLHHVVYRSHEASTERPPLAVTGEGDESGWA